MTAYGDDNTVATMLEPSTNSGFSEVLTTRIAAMREVVSRLIDEETGRSWGTAGTSETRTLRWTYTGGGLILLSVPARTVTAITVNTTDQAGVVSGGTVLPSTHWTIGLTDAEGNITALRIGTGSWYSGWWYTPAWPSYGTITVTGIWADTGVDTDIPAEINWACNYITAKSIAEEQASPAGFVGSDGAVVPIRNPWSDPKVKKILRKYELATHGLVL